MVTYVSDELVRNFRFIGDSGCLDGVLVQLVLLRKLVRLIPSLVLAVDAGGDLAEEHQLLLL